MCGRFTNKLTWDDIVRLYRLTLNAPPHNLRPRYNVCPTDTIDTIVFEQDVRSLVAMRWGLVPRWWSKTLKDIKLATFSSYVKQSFATSSFQKSYVAKSLVMVSQALLMSRSQHNRLAARRLLSVFPESGASN